MALAAPHETALDDALDQLRREGGPVPVRREGATVAMLLAPEELERLEDERDAAVGLAAKAAQAGEPRVSLQDLAMQCGVTNTGTK